MSDDRTKHLAKLRQLYESGALDEETCQATITALGTTPTADADLKGSGAIAQGDDSQAVGQKGIGVTGDLGIGVTGDQNVIVIAAEVAETFWQQFRPQRLSREELQQATERYLTYLLDRYRFLDFKGMGVSDRVPLRLPLIEM